MPEDSFGNEVIENGYALIKKEAGSIVHWLKANEREAFLEERKELAFARK
jgi:hypothetical protein